MEEVLLHHPMMKSNLIKPLIKPEELKFLSMQAVRTYLKYNTIRQVTRVTWNIEKLAPPYIRMLKRVNNCRELLVYVNRGCGSITNQAIVDVLRRNLRVRKVGIYGEEIEDILLLDGICKEINCLPQLKWLQIKYSLGCGNEATGTINLKGLRNLNYLYLKRGFLDETSEGWLSIARSIRGFEKLERLYLIDDSYTVDETDSLEVFMESISHLKNLREVFLQVREHYIQNDLLLKSRYPLILLNT